MTSRCELSPAQWRRIEGLLPGKAGDPGRSGEDNRLFVNGVLWVLRSEHIGMTFPNATVSGRRCISVSDVGQRLAFGSVFLLI